MVKKLLIKDTPTAFIRNGRTENLRHGQKGRSKAKQRKGIPDNLKKRERYFSHPPKFERESGQKKKINTFKGKEKTKVKIYKLKDLR